MELKEYLEKIKTDLQTTPVIGIDYDFDTEYLIWKTIAETRPYGFIIDDLNRPIIETLIRYWNNDALDPRKGICLAGPNGTGKSELMLCFQKYVFYRRYRYFRIESAESLNIKYKIHGAKIIEEYSTNQREVNIGIYKNKPFDLNICDFGFQGAARHYGDSEQVIDSILFLRYDLLKKGIRTHLTTNLKREQIEEHYKGRLNSRFYEMFNWIELKGNDRRKL